MVNFCRPSLSDFHCFCISQAFPRWIPWPLLMTHWHVNKKHQDVNHNFWSCEPTNSLQAGHRCSSSSMSRPSSACNSWLLRSWCSNKALAMELAHLKLMQEPWRKHCWVTGRHGWQVWGIVEILYFQYEQCWVVDLHVGDNLVIQSRACPKFVMTHSLFFFRAVLVSSLLDNCTCCRFDLRSSRFVHFLLRAQGLKLRLLNCFPWCFEM